MSGFGSAASVSAGSVVLPSPRVSREQRDASDPLGAGCGACRPWGDPCLEGLVGHAQQAGVVGEVRAHSVSAASFLGLKQRFGTRT